MPATDVPADDSGGALLALVEEACRRSALVWVRVDGARARAVWHVWHDGAVCLVVDGGEQPLPGLGTAGEVTVVARSKDKGGRLISFTARVVPVLPDTAPWAPTAAALMSARLNAPDGERAPLRWAASSRILRLEPVAVVEHPAAMPTGSLAATPAETPATTLGRLPYVLGRKRR